MHVKPKNKMQFMILLAPVNGPHFQILFDQPLANLAIHLAKNAFLMVSHVRRTQV